MVAPGELPGAVYGLLQRRRIDADDRLGGMDSSDRPIAVIVHCTQVFADSCSGLAMDIDRFALFAVVVVSAALGGVADCNFDEGIAGSRCSDDGACQMPSRHAYPFW